jgi:hypothetical protein
MNRLTLLCVSLSLGLCLALDAVAQTSGSFDYSAYNAVSAGVFANFTYPAGPLFRGTTGDDGRRSFTLSNGIFQPGFNERGHIERIGAYLKSVEFADVTGDRHKEAIVAVGNLCECSGVWFGVYVYKLSDNKPARLLWAFRTGDRAVGGLRNVYGRRGRLIVELYGSGSSQNLPPEPYYGAQCCTQDYTQRRYRWNGRRFIQEGKARLMSEARKDDR